MSIADLRRDYRARALSEADADPDPIAQFRRWLDEAIRAELLDATAMTLATSAADGTPDARIVLLKDVTVEGFTFYTNYESAKAAQLDARPAASLVFFWAELERQVRVAGTATRATSTASDAYFSSRPLDSQLGAWASPQSRVIPAARCWSRRSPTRPRSSPVVPCRDRRTGAATSSRHRRSSSGRAARTVCTIGCAIAASAAVGPSIVWPPDLSPALSRRHPATLQFFSTTQWLHRPQMSR